MHPSKVLTLLALGISFFSLFAHASSDDDMQKKEEPPAARKKIMGTTARKRAEIPKLMAHDPRKDKGENSLSENERLPLHEIDQEEAERQRNPTNFMARIMMRYRKDLGLTPVLDFGSPSAPVDEVLNFLACFGYHPQDISTDAQSFDEIVKAYSFFKYIGRIPLNPTFPDQCQEVMDTVGLSSFEDILKVYKETRSDLTVINWDLLNLVPFKHQYFPVTESMIKPFEFVYEVHGRPELKRKYTTPPSLTCYGKAVLQRHVDKIRFLNPKMRKDRNILLYQRIYRRYLQALGRNANPYYIDWGNCTVENWPDLMDRSQISNWTDDDVILMNALIDGDLLIFNYSSRIIQGAPSSLGKPSKVGPEYYTDIKKITGDKKTELSDDEDFGGEERVQLLKKIKMARSINAKKTDENKKKAKITKRVFQKDESESVEEAEFEEYNPQKKQRADSEQFFNEESEFDEGYEKKMFAKSDSKSPSSKSFPSTKKAKSPNSKSAKKFEAEKSKEVVKIINVKDNSSNPATPEARQSMLNEMMGMFRKQTGKSDATEIDWSLSKVHHLQNHLLPFSTNFGTVGDIKTLKNLIISKSFRFLNSSKPADRKIRAYERLFAIYAQTAGKYRNEYDIEWDDVEFTGLPDDLDEKFANWGKDTVTFIESQLDNNAITCELTEDIKEEIAEVEAKFNEKMLNERPIELPGSPVSMTSGSSSVKSSDVEIGSTDETSSSTSLLVDKASIEGRQRKRETIGVWKHISNPITSNEEQFKTPRFMFMMKEKSSTKKLCCPLDGDEGGVQEGEQEDLGVNKNRVFIKDETNLEVETEFPVATANPKYVPVGRCVTIPFNEPTQMTSSSSSANSVDEDRVISEGQFAGSSVSQVLAHQNSIQASISDYVQVRESFSENSRHRRLMNNIIRCLELILDNARNFDIPDPRLMGITEIHEYLNIFLNSLAKLGSANEIENISEWKKLVIATVKFHARLAGAKISYSRKRTIFTIDVSIIASDCFEFLAGPVNKWDLVMLDQFIDGVEDTPVFKNN